MGKVRCVPSSLFPPLTCVFHLIATSCPFSGKHTLFMQMLEDSSCSPPLWIPLLFAGGENMCVI